jgi:hypothetical protein
MDLEKKIDALSPQSKAVYSNELASDEVDGLASCGEVGKGMNLESILTKSIGR